MQELLALGERIGNVSTGLTEDIIKTQLKTRSYISSATVVNLEEEEGSSLDQNADYCIICQVKDKSVLSCLHLWFWVLFIWEVCYLVLIGSYIDFTGSLSEPRESRNARLRARVPRKLLKEVAACEECLSHLQIRSIGDGSKGTMTIRALFKLKSSVCCCSL